MDSQDDPKNGSSAKLPPGSQDFADRLSSERLDLIPVTTEVAQELNDAIASSLSELTLWLPWAKTCPTVADTAEFCALSELQVVARTDYPLVMRLRGTGELLGSVGLHRIDWSVPAFEVGYWCATAHTGRGYVTEGVAELARYVFEELGAVRLSLHADTRNGPSRAVAERLGFHLDGVLRSDTRDNEGVPCDTVIYSLTSLSEMRAP